MEIKIVWTDFAKLELQKIFSYYTEMASLKVAKRLASGIVRATVRLKDQPESGPIEPLLTYHKKEFRYLLYKNYKIIYRFNEEKHWIEINDVFDTRQNPVKIRRTE